MATKRKPKKQQPKQAAPEYGRFAGVIRMAPGLHNPQPEPDKPKEPDAAPVEVVQDDHE
jgi:hypothetical protein